jgi:hypothetical protein
MREIYIWVHVLRQLITKSLRQTCAFVYVYSEPASVTFYLLTTNKHSDDLTCSCYV